jgi:hypothetical protein
MKKERRIAFGLLLVGALFGPPALMSAYLYLSRWPTRWFTGDSDWGALGLSVAVGAACIAGLPMPGAWRLVLAIVYVPVAVFALIVYSLSFVGTMFGDWL